MDSISQVTQSSSTLRSIIQPMADEIWMEIFDWYATQYCTFRATAPTTSALVLGQVCRQWQRIALSMPQLWNHLPIVHVTGESINQEHFKEGWERFLLRSGSLPLKLHLSFEIPIQGIPYRPYGILKPFFDNCDRWEHLTISGLMVMQTQVHLGLVHNNLPSLRSLTLNFVKTVLDFIPSIRFDVFQYAPQLTKINLHSPSTVDRKSNLYFPWGQLTVYKETGIDIGTFPMLRSPALETLRYKCRNFTYQVLEPVFNPNLRHLIVEVHDAIDFWVQLDDITLPILETFSFRILPNPLDEESLDISTLESLIVRSGCVLKKLVLGIYQINPVELTHLFSCLNDLESLELFTCLDEEFVRGTLAGLTFEKDRKVLLPRLRSLTLKPWGTSDIIATVSQITTSREKVFLDHRFPGQLLAPLEHVRIVMDGYLQRYGAIYQLGGWGYPLEKAFNPPRQASSLSSTLAVVLTHGGVNRHSSLQFLTL